MLRVELLPAAHGDAIWLEYGDADDPSRVLIDGGPHHTYPELLRRISLLPREQRVLELLVVTHIDADHIEGIVRLLRDAEQLGVTFGEIWFNGRPQLDGLPDAAGAALGVVAGEYLGLLIGDLEAVGTDLWNTSNGRAAIYVPDQGEVPVFTLPGGLELTLLSPDLHQLLTLKDKWQDVVEDEDLPVGDPDQLRADLEASDRFTPLADTLGTADGPPSWFEPIDPSIDLTLGGSAETRPDAAPGSDTSIPNGSSIAFVAQFDDERIILAGDAYASVLAATLQRLGFSKAKPIKVDTFKVPHHGSIGNVTPELLQLIKAKRYLVSTSGAQFGHPHRHAIELIVEHHRGPKPLLAFNYRTATTEPWADGAVKSPPGPYRSMYPAGVSLQVPEE